MLYRPLSRLETAACATVVAVLITVFIDRMLDQMELAERTAMEVTVSRVNSGVNTFLAYDRLRGIAIGTSWSERNPFELARMSPPNFLGERSSARVSSLEKGSWIYDGRRRELVYLPRWKRSLRTRDPDGVLRFRLQPAAGREGFLLVPTFKYDWQ